MTIKSGAHCKFELQYHFVWFPKYRRLSLTGNRGRYLCKLIYELSERYDFDIVELSVMPDDVHMFVSSSAEVSSSPLNQVVKIITSREMINGFAGIKQLRSVGSLLYRV